MNDDVENNVPFVQITYHLREYYSSTHFAICRVWFEGEFSLHNKNKDAKNLASIANLQSSAWLPISHQMNGT